MAAAGAEAERENAGMLLLLLQSLARSGLLLVLLQNILGHDIIVLLLPPVSAATGTARSWPPPTGGGILIDHAGHDGPCFLLTPSAPPDNKYPPMESIQFG